jgi:hypothetical protein
MEQPETKTESNGYVFDERYAEAFLHVPLGHRILGVKLKPFSAWHRTVLEYIDSPVVTGEQVLSGDLRMAVEVCRRNYPNTPPPAKGIGRFFSESRNRREANRAAGNPQRHLESVSAFFGYVEDYVSLPKLMFGSKKGNVVTERSAVPDIDQTLMDVAIYRYYTGCPRSEPWDLPLGELLWMNAAIAKTQGVDLHVVTTIEEESLLRHKQGVSHG